MGKLYEEFRKFLDTATPEQLENARKRAELYKDVGPSVLEYVSEVLTFGNPVGAIKESKISNNSDPEYNSGFFNSQYYHGESFFFI